MAEVFLWLYCFSQNMKSIATGKFSSLKYKNEGPAVLPGLRFYTCLYFVFFFLHQLLQFAVPSLPILSNERLFKKLINPHS